MSALASTLAQGQPLKTPPGFDASPGTTAEPYTNTGWAKEIVEKTTGMELVFIPAGEFDMGGTWNLGLHEFPVHHVRITKPFYLGKYQVTRGEWKTIMGANKTASVQELIGENTPLKHFVPLAEPWVTHGNRFVANDPGQDDARLPAATGSWDIAHTFLQRYSQKLGSSAAVMRMPTEAEYEYACRAGSKSVFFYGDDAYTSVPHSRWDLKNNCTELTQYAWYDHLWRDSQSTNKLSPAERAIQKYHMVGRLQPNPWGLYDIMGNLSNWCGDWFSNSYYDDCLAKGTVDNPKGPASSPNGLRVVRGGYFAQPAWNCRSASRDHYQPDVDWGNAGIRVVVEIGTGKSK